MGATPDSMLPSPAIPLVALTIPLRRGVKWHDGAGGN
jgi:hypothetical protein